MITHSHRRSPQFLLGFHPFTGVVLQLIGGAEPPLAPPLVYATGHTYNLRDALRM